MNPSPAQGSRRRFIPHWSKATWALVIFTVVMALGATASALVVTATENVSEAEIQDCMAPFLFGSPDTREHCDDVLHSGDDVITGFVALWAIVTGVVAFIWLKRRPG
jgi:hypothetical protein